MRLITFGAAECGHQHHSAVHRCRDCGEMLRHGLMSIAARARDCDDFLSPRQVSASDVINQPGTCKAVVPANTRQVSAWTNFEKLLLLSSSSTACIHCEKVSAQSPLCSSTIRESHACLNHCQSFLWPGESPAPMRASRSRTSIRLPFPLPLPALGQHAPSAAGV